MTFFVVVMEHGPAWDDARGIREQAGWAPHAAFMDGLVDEGFVVLGGPLSDGHRALLVIRAPDEDAVRARLELDPWVPMRLLTIGLLEPWAIWLDGSGGWIKARADPGSPPDRHRPRPDAPVQSPAPPA